MDNGVGGVAKIRKSYFLEQILFYVKFCRPNPSFSGVLFLMAGAILLMPGPQKCCACRRNPTSKKRGFFDGGRMCFVKRMSEPLRLCTEKGIVESSGFIETRSEFVMRHAESIGLAIKYGAGGEKRTRKNHSFSTIVGTFWVSFLGCFLMQFRTSLFPILGALWEAILVTFSHFSGFFEVLF